ncbi:MAG: 3-phosphoshikimate 1-carboxyvinyltransferase [Candidatus Shikimatogenerans sp. Tcar]|uniref:3-phosphoshikimate 1-carboxyvinyltransferase n=1 Tax=Candidatus Shikimatogenerans sp. Tcar TaxID=3158565 RepID=A0AAU7QS72_9FLAO
MIKIFHKNFIINNTYLKISGSKSISNRLLILNKIFNTIKLKNLSNSDDSNLLINILNKNKKYINIKNSGSVLRFLLTFLCFKNNFFILYGIKRMYKRPINYLIDSLKEIGANIYYLKKKNFPPILIKNFFLNKKKIYIKSNISSQYISSLLLNILYFKNKKIKIILKNNIISYPYIKMTYLILKYLNFSIHKKNNIITINNKKKKIKKIYYYIESDWTSISYYYSLSVFFKIFNLKLGYFYKNSLQGDSIISKIYYKYFNIYTIFNKKYIYIKKKKKYINIQNIYLNLNKYPDLAQTIIVTLSLLKKNFYIEGLETLNIKETNRLIALKKELKKIGVIVKINFFSIKLIKYFNINLNKIIKINSYNDHRMIMSFIPVCLLYKNFYINNYNVVKKSYPFFWKDLKKCNFCLKFYENKK